MALSHGCSRCSVTLHLLVKKLFFLPILFVGDKDDVKILNKVPVLIKAMVLVQLLVRKVFFQTLFVSDKR